jgi:hypothetical protein
VELVTRPKSTLDLAHELCLKATKAVRHAENSLETFTDWDRVTDRIEQLFRVRRLRTVPGFKDLKMAYPFEVDRDSSDPGKARIIGSKLADFKKANSDLREALFAFMPLGFSVSESLPTEVKERLSRIPPLFDHVLQRIRRDGQPSTSAQRRPGANWYVENLWAEVEELGTLLTGSFEYFDHRATLDDFQFAPAYRLSWAYKHVEFGQTWTPRGAAYRPGCLPLAERILNEFKKTLSNLRGEDLGSREARKQLNIARALQLVSEHPVWSNAKIARTIGVHPSTLSRSNTYKMGAAMARDPKVMPSGGFDRRTGSVVPEDSAHDDPYRDEYESRSEFASWDDDESAY